MRTTRRTLDFAERLRREMSPPAVRLWVRLQETQPGFPRFRRRHPMRPYALDVYCPAARLGVEVDGWMHGAGDPPERDARRDAWLEARGLEVMRLAAS